MRDAIRLALLFCLGLSPVMIRAETSPKQSQPAPPPEHWIERLGSRDFLVREEAFKALEALGPAALPAVRHASVYLDLEVRKRLQALLPVLEHQVLLAPARVSLHLKNRPLAEAVAEVARQTGYGIQLGEHVDQVQRLYSFDCDNLPFWEAMDQLCEAGGLDYQGQDYSGLSLSHQETHAPFVYRSGLFRLTAQGFQYASAVDLSRLPRNGVQPLQRSYSLTFTFNIMPEPRTPLLWVGNPRVTAAYDDQSRSMLPEQDTAQDGTVGRYGNGYRSFAEAATLNLRWPSRKSHTVKLLRGIVPVIVVGEVQPVTIVEGILSARGKDFRRGNLTWDVQDVAAVSGNAHQYVISLSIRNSDRATAGDYGWIRSLRQRVELWDARGNKYRIQSARWHGKTAEGVRAALVFDGKRGDSEAGPPARLVFDDWVTLYHPLRFEFRDLPLP